MLFKETIRTEKICITRSRKAYLPEGNLTHFEHLALEAALPDARLVNALDIVDRLSMIKDEGTINRFRCPEEETGFRYENAILITEDGCEIMSKYPLAVEEFE